MLELLDIAVLFFLALLVRLVWIQIDANRIAKRAAKKYCDKNDVQLLDQSIVLKSFRLKKSKSSLIAIERIFKFEFASIGDQRYQGKVLLQGFRVIDVELEPYKIDL